MPSHIHAMPARTNGRLVVTKLDDGLDVSFDNGKKVVPPEDRQKLAQMCNEARIIRLIVAQDAIAEHAPPVVTLGGTGKAGGDRHPKIGDGVMLGAGAKILGNISVGTCSRVAAGSVVLVDVPANSTVAGVPAKVVGTAGCSDPARSMDQMISAQD